MEIATSSPTCDGCGAALPSASEPCPYCGRMPAVQPVRTPEHTPTVAVFVESNIPQAEWVQVQRPPLAPQISARAARKVGVGCILGAMALLVVAVGLPIWITMTVLSSVSSAVQPILNMVPDNPTAAAATHLAPLNAYMQAGADKDAASAYSLFMHGLGVTVPSQSDLTTEFTKHPEHYAGYKSVSETGLVRVHAYGGNGSYWEERAVATYANGSPRVVYADMIQHDGWKLYEVTFPDEPVP